MKMEKEEKTAGYVIKHNNDKVWVSNYTGGNICRKEYQNHTFSNVLIDISVPDNIKSWFKSLSKALNENCEYCSYLFKKVDDTWNAYTYFQKMAKTQDIEYLYLSINKLNNIKISEEVLNWLNNIDKKDQIPEVRKEPKKSERKVEINSDPFARGQTASSWLTYFDRILNIDKSLAPSVDTNEIFSK